MLARTSVSLTIPLPGYSELNEVDARIRLADAGAELISRSHDEPLSVLDKLRLRLHLHLSLCGNCSTVEQQLGAVRALAGEAFDSEDVDTVPATLPPASIVRRRDGTAA